MAVARRVAEADEYVWEESWRTWELQLLLGHDVFGATLGIVALGRIGQAVARRAESFQMRVLYYDAVRKQETEGELGVKYAGLDDLLR